MVSASTDIDFEDEEEKQSETPVNLAALQEKQDQIDQLQDELEAERNKLNETLKLIADFKEELSIKEGQLENAQNERDQVTLK